MQIAKWYVKTGERVQGPFSEDQIRKGLGEHQIAAEMLVRRDDSDWIPAAVLQAKFRQHDRSKHRDKPINGRLHSPPHHLPRETPVPAKPRVGNSLSTSRRSCPFCAEAIATVAIKCKHCGEFFDGRESNPSSSTADPESKPASHEPTLTELTSDDRASTSSSPSTRDGSLDGTETRKRPMFAASILSMVLPKRMNGSHRKEVPHDVYAKHDIGTIEEFVTKVLAICKRHPEVAKDVDEITGSDGDVERALLVNMDEFNMLAIVTVLARHNLINEVLQS